MTIKERVLTSAKTSFAKYGFKKEELSSLVDIISANLTDESTDDEINAALTSAEGYAKMMQSVYNRGISETTERFKGYVPKPVETVEPKPTPTPTGLTEEQVQSIIDASLAKAMEPFKERAEAERLAGLLAGHEKLKSIPKVFSGKYKLEKEEDLDELAARIERDFTAVKQSLVSSGQFVEAPSKTSPQDEADDFAEMMKGFAERNAKQA